MISIRVPPARIQFRICAMKQENLLRPLTVPVSKLSKSLTLQPEWLRRYRKSTQETRGIADVNTRLGDIPGYDSAGSDNHVVADGYRQHGGIRSDTHMVAKLG